MKTFSIAVLGVALILALTSCSGTSSALGPEDDGTTIDVAVGETLTVELPANPSTGYTWVVVDSGPFDDPGEPEFEQDAASQELVGSGGIDRFVFERSSADAGTIVLEYRRPWESEDIAAEDTWSIDVSSAGE